MEKLTRRRSTPTQVPPSSSFPSLLLDFRIYSAPSISLEICADRLKVKRRFSADLGKKESQGNGQKRPLTDGSPLTLISKDVPVTAGSRYL